MKNMNAYDNIHTLEYTEINESKHPSFCTLFIAPNMTPRLEHTTHPKEAPSRILLQVQVVPSVVLDHGLRLEFAVLW